MSRRSQRTPIRAPTLSPSPPPPPRRRSKHVPIVYNISESTPRHQPALDAFRLTVCPPSHHRRDEDDDVEAKRALLNSLNEKLKVRVDFPDTRLETDDVTSSEQNKKKKKKKKKRAKSRRRDEEHRDPSERDQKRAKVCAPATAPAPSSDDDCSEQSRQHLLVDSSESPDANWSPPTAHEVKMERLERIIERIHRRIGFQPQKEEDPKICPN